jgi:hypothetical protein
MTSGFVKLVNLSESNWKWWRRITRTMPVMWQTSQYRFFRNEPEPEDLEFFEWSRRYIFETRSWVKQPLRIWLIYNLKNQSPVALIQCSAETAEKRSMAGGDGGVPAIPLSVYCCVPLRPPPAYVSQHKVLVASTGHYCHLPVNRMSRRLEENTGEYDGGRSLKASGEMWRKSRSMGLLSAASQTRRLYYDNLISWWHCCPRGRWWNIKQDSHFRYR